MRIFLQKNKNVKIVKLVKVKLDVSPPNMLDLPTLLLNAQESKDSIKKSSQSQARIKTALKKSQNLVRKAVPNLKKEETKKAARPPVSVKFVGHAAGLKDRIKVSKVKRFAPVVKYVRARTVARKRKAREEEEEEESSSDEEIEKAPNLELDLELMDIVHR